MADLKRKYNLYGADVEVDGRSDAVFVASFTSENTVLVDIIYEELLNRYPGKNRTEFTIKSIALASRIDVLDIDQKDVNDVHKK